MQGGFHARDVQKNSLIGRRIVFGLSYFLSPVENLHQRFGMPLGKHCRKLIRPFLQYLQKRHQAFDVMTLGGGVNRKCAHQPALPISNGHSKGRHSRHKLLVTRRKIILGDAPNFRSQRPGISQGTVWVRRVGNNIALTLAAISIPLLSILFGFWLYSFSGTTGPLFANSTHPILAGVTHTGAAFVLTSVLVATAVFRADINWTGPHWLYREGLRRTFVQLPEPDDRTATRESGAKGIKTVAARWKASVSQLMHARSGKNRNNIPISEIDPQGKAPYLLMNAVVNLPSSKLPKLRERKGDFFLFSRRFCGSPVTRYTETPKWVSRNETLDLATAVAISGAAVAPQMGLLSISAARALLSFLNVRLGFWVLNPHLTYKGLRKVPGAWQLLREMFAYRMDADEPWVMLTDGAHLENSGVYGLLRRRCRFIVAIDASADPNGKFDTLLTLARHARIDFGIRIEPKLDDLRVDPDTGLAPAHGIMGSCVM
ncbi:hypothetical protein [Ruegeria sp. MALMAid1280]|uniref:hypothetical protein n=1 Tax=Ruegeria sp. MALMAid1280 TaxID=3411634 RepID=UPI003B9DE2C3